MAISYYTTETKRHWLSDVAEATGLSDLRLPPRATFAQIRSAWAEIARTARVSEEELAERVARHFRLKVADLDAAEPQCARLLPEELARTHGVVPLRASDQILVVATSDPVSLEAEQSIQFLSGRQPVFQVAAPGPLMEALDRTYSREKIVDFVLQTLAAEASSDEVQVPRAPEQTEPAQTPTIARLVNRILRSAIDAEASEVRVEAEREAGRVRFVIDGVVDHFMHLPHPALIRVIRRLKELARMDLHERGKGQEGRFQATVRSVNYRVLVEVHPAGAVERVQLRITRPDAAPGVADLGFSADEARAITELVQDSGGLILVGSPEPVERERLVNGILLHAADTLGNGVNIASQIGFDLPGVEQVKVDPARGFPVSSALAAALDQGARVVALEHLDEPEAAALAMEAAGRGVLICAGVDGDDLGTPLAHVVELGVDRRTLAPALRGVVQTRFMRRLCSCAKEPGVPDDIPSAERALAEAYGVSPQRVSVGCDACRGTGFRGQVPVAETLAVGPEVRQALEEGQSVSTIRHMASGSGMQSIRQAAHARVSDGQTTLREVERVLGSTMMAAPRPTPPTVLVVDDTAADRLLMRTLLEQQGYDVVEANGGGPALDALERHADISLVLLDLLMPDMSGKEALRKIRGNLRTAGLPVIILTAAEDPRLEVELLESGADDYLGKPFDPSRLAVRVRAVLRRAGSYDPDVV